MLNVTRVSCEYCPLPLSQSCACDVLMVLLLVNYMHFNMCHFRDFLCKPNASQFCCCCHRNSELNLPFCILMLMYMCLCLCLCPDHC